MAVQAAAEETELGMTLAMAAQAEEAEIAIAATDVTASALHRAVEWLRPFVETMGWAYVVVWKLGDDPSRFFEWVGCCCSGSVTRNVKEEEPYGNLAPLCRDDHCKHLVRTRACEGLARLPYLIPLYAGLHGEVAISNQHRWISPAISTASSFSSESAGTRVLIPVAAGIVELFNVKNVPEERNIVELIRNQCQFFSSRVSGMTSLNGMLLGNYLGNSAVSIYAPSSVNFPRFLAHKTQSKSNSPSYNGSSSSANPSGDCTPTVSRDVGSSSRKQNFSGSSSCNKNGSKRRSRTPGEVGHSKNLLAEQRRRNRIKEKLFALRAIVPKISNMDRASIVTDAMDYITELKGEIKSLKDELKRMDEEEEDKLKDMGSKIPKSNGEIKFSKNSSVTKSDGSNSCLGIPCKEEVQVEVNRIGKRDLMIRLVCEKRAGWFSRLMEALCSFELVLRDANVTTLNNMALTVLRLEMQRDIYPKILKDSLTKIVCS